MNKGFWLYFIFMLLIVNTIFQSIMWSIPENDTTKNVECYDKYGNEIIGQTCIKEINGVSLSEKLTASMLILVSSIVVSLILNPFRDSEI